MVEKLSRATTRHTGTRFAGLHRSVALTAALALSAGWMTLTPPARAQTANPDPAAASGMTSGLPGVSTARQAEMMQVRARAQAARPEAERAAIERSADAALEERTQQQLIDESRQIKLLKEQAAQQLEHQRAADAYRGVSPGEINSWADNTGRVKVERGVPPEILASLPPEDETDPAAEDEEGGFHPFRASKRAVQGATDTVVGAAKKGVSWIKRDEPVETGLTATPRTREAPEAESKSMLQKIPLVGGMIKRDGGGEEPSPTVAEPAEAGAEKKGFFRGLTSKIPLVGDRGKAAEPDPAVSPMPTPAVGSPLPPAIATMTGSVDPSFGPQTPPATGNETGDSPAGVNAAENGGFFKKLPLIGSNRGGEKSEEIPAPITPADGNAGLAESGKPGVLGGLKGLVGRVVPGGNETAGGIPATPGGSGPIDPSLFPQEGDPDTMMAENSRKKLLKLPSLPDLSMPSLPNVSLASESKAPEPKKVVSPVHSGGSASYVVHKNGAQFMRFGSSGPLGSESLSLSVGTIVTKTKVGDEWSTIQLADGSTGIVRNSDLKPSNAPAPAGVAASPVGPSAPLRGGIAASAPGGPVRITAPVSATGAGVSDVPGPPVSIPTSALTDGGPIPPPSTILPPAP